MRKEKRAVEPDEEVIALSKAEEAGRLPDSDRREYDSAAPAVSEIVTGDNAEPASTTPVFPPGYRVTTDDVRAMQ